MARLGGNREALAALHERFASARASEVASAPTGKLKDGRRTKAAEVAWDIARHVADPDLIVAAIDLLQGSWTATEAEGGKGNLSKREIKTQVRSAAKKRAGSATREALAAQDAREELVRALNAEAPTEVDADVASNERWSAWDDATGDPILRVIEGIPPIIFLPGLEEVVPKGCDLVLAAAYKVGKTFLIVAWMMMLARAGLKVLVIDFENGENQFARRVEQVANAWGLSHDDLRAIRGNLIYKQFPEITREDAKRFAREAVQADVVIFDSVAGLMERFGVEENDNDGAKLLHRAIMEPLKRAGTTCITLANSGHSDTTRMRGASGWLGAFEAIYSLDGEPFSATKASDLTLKCGRSRYGVVGEWIWRMGAKTYVGPVSKEEADKPIPEDFKRQAERIGRRLGDETISATKFLERIRAAGVKFTRATALVWLAKLAEDPECPFTAADDGGYEPFRFD